MAPQCGECGVDAANGGLDPVVHRLACAAAPVRSQPVRAAERTLDPVQLLFQPLAGAEVAAALGLRQLLAQLGQALPVGGPGSRLGGRSRSPAQARPRGLEKAL